MSGPRSASAGRSFSRGLPVRAGKPSRRFTAQVLKGPWSQAVKEARIAKAAEGRVGSALHSLSDLGRFARRFPEGRWSAWEPHLFGQTGFVDGAGGSWPGILDAPMMGIALLGLLTNGLIDQMVGAVQGRWMDPVCGSGGAMTKSVACSFIGQTQSIPNSGTGSFQPWVQTNINGNLWTLVTPGPVNSVWRFEGRQTKSAGAPALILPYEVSPMGSVAPPAVNLHPWIDPNSWPAGSTAPNPNLAKVPHNLLPARQTNPMRSPNEQSQFGYSIPETEPLSSPDAVPVAPPVVVPPLEPPSGGGSDAPPPRAKPGKKTRERKGLISRGLWKVLSVYGKGTELADASDAVYEALPHSLKVMIYRRLGRQPNSGEKALAVFLNLSKLNLTDAVWNVFVSNWNDTVSFAELSPYQRITTGNQGFIRGMARRLGLRDSDVEKSLRLDLSSWKLHMRRD